MKSSSFLFACSVLLLLSSASSAVASNLLRESNPQESADEFSKFYLIAGGHAHLARSVVNSANSFSVALGAGYHFLPSFSCELGASYGNLNLESDVDAKGHMTGVMAAFVYHKTIPGNLKYIPQLEVDYLTGSVQKNRVGLVGMAVAPLAFEYRDDDSFVGITAGIGEFGVFYPVSGFVDKSKPVYVFSLNDVSLGIVLYF